MPDKATMFKHFQQRYTTPTDSEQFFTIVGDVTPSDETLSFDSFDVARGTLYNHLIEIACHADQVQLPSHEQLTETLGPLNAAANDLFASILNGEGELDDKIDFISTICAADNNERCGMIEQSLGLSATMTYLDQSSANEQIRRQLNSERYEGTDPQEALSAIYSALLRTDVDEFMRHISQREQTRTLIREEQATVRASRHARDIAAVALGAGLAILTRRYLKN